MAYVPVPKDLTKVKSKVMFNLTKRQLICFGGGALIGVPLFLLLRGGVGTSTASIIMILSMLPFFLVGMYERNGRPLEQVLRNVAHVVLANTVEHKDYDGRFSHENKEWAKGVSIPQMTKEQRAAFVWEAHPAILDGFIRTARKQQQEKKPSIVEHLSASVKPSQSKKSDPSREEQGR